MWLDKLDKRFGRYAMPNLTLVLVAGQVLFFLIGSGTRETLGLMWLDYGRLLAHGEIWRLVTFLFIPPDTHPVFLLFAWYFFYLMGKTLETQWGHFRYNLFVLIGWLATIAAGYLAFRLGSPIPVTNTYLGGTIFLAFAYLYPDFQILLFFLLPVRIKWLALITWVSYFLSFVAATHAAHWTQSLAILAATANFLLFFGREILGRMRNANRRMTFQTAAIRTEIKPRHVCRSCQANNVENPDMDFRYCTECKPAQCYCPKHIDRHAHTKDYRA
jgi:membrane associated rhomboid family serine protease